MNECRCNTLLGNCDLHPRQWPGSSDTQRAPIIEVPNNVNQAQVLVTRMFESLQADVARLEAKDEERWTLIGQHELAMQSVETRMSALEREMLHQFEVLAIKIIEYGDRQQLIMQKLETEFEANKKGTIEAWEMYRKRGDRMEALKREMIQGFLDQRARFELIEQVHNQMWFKHLQQRARKRQPKPVRRKGRK